MEYIEILILTSVDADNLAGLLDEPGFLGIWENQDRLHVYWSAKHWDPGAQTAILHALAGLAISDPHQHIRINRLPWEDWNAQWGKLVEPVRIGRRFLIRPSWKSLDHDQSLIELIIDPKQAFGTGHHTTTQLVIEMMEEIIVGNERVLDIGTGSGILGMVALRLGSREVLGIDTDPTAIQCAQEYALVNSIHRGLRFHTGVLDDLPVQPYDFLLANLDRRTLLQISKDLHRQSKPGSQLLVSGILLEDREEIVRALADSQRSMIEFRQREEWAGLHLSFNPPALHEASATVQASFPRIE